MLVAQEVVPAKGHTEVIDAAVAATCTATGLTEGKHCSVCNEVLVYQQIVPTVAHSYTSVVTNPTCTTIGYTTHTCKDCNHSYINNIDLTVVHTEVTDAAVAATCTATGLTEGKHCGVCNEVLVAQEVVPCHNFENYVCSECGFHYYTEGLVFILLNDEYSVTGYTGSDVDVVIPAIYNNKSVTSIGYEAFIGCESLTNITIPNSVTSIETYAFAVCSSLTSITIPNSLTSIGLGAFAGCSSLTSIKVDENNKVYDSRNNCNAIIETSTNTLILGCQNTIIPNSVTSIDSHAFSGCSSLTSITIPDSVTSIGGSVFYGCSSLTSIKVDENNKVYDSRNNCNAIIETATNTLVIGCQNTIIPNSVTSIGVVAFYGCTSLTSITIPNSVTSIETYAFYGCSSLTSITIPDSVTSIGDGAFYLCSSLTTVYYTGTEEQWLNISIDFTFLGNDELMNAIIIYNYAEE